MPTTGNDDDDHHHGGGPLSYVLKWLWNYKLMLGKVTMRTAYFVLATHVLAFLAGKFL